MNVTRVGIMSMQRIINYGSFLQAYGLRKIIEQITNSDVEFVDYRFGRDIAAEEREQSENSSLLAKIRQNRTPQNYIKKMLYFKQVRKSLLLDLKTIGVDGDNYESNVDALVIGSDEVFNCMQPHPVGYSEQLFGRDYEQCSVISYAASFGSTRYEDLVRHGIDQEIGDMLRKFKAISVRDENSAFIVNKLLGINPDIHMDPVLMYDFEKEIEDHPTAESGYIIVYAYAGRLTREEEDYIKRFAHRLNKKIISIGHYSGIADDNIICNPLYVFSYFKNADYIITDTFHGTVFSIKMNAKFCTLVRESNKNKLIALLKKLERLDRKVDELSDIEKLYYTEIDYSQTNDVIKYERNRTMAYIARNLTDHE